MCLTFDWMMTRDKKLSDVVVKHFCEFLFFSAILRDVRLNENTYYWPQTIHNTHSTRSINWYTKESGTNCGRTTLKRLPLTKLRHWTTHTSPTAHLHLSIHKRLACDRHTKTICVAVLSFLFICFARWLAHSFWFDCNFINAKLAAVMQITASKSRRLHSIDGKWLVDILPSIKFE